MALLETLADSLADEKLKKSAHKDLQVISSACIKIGKALENIDKIEQHAAVIHRKRKKKRFKNIIFIIS